MRSPQPPMDPAFLRTLVQERMPFDPTVVDIFQPPEQCMPEIPVPTDEELFRHARVPRAKSPGPDGVPPYLIYLLPPRLFHLVANCIRLSISLDHPLPLFYDAQLIGLYKPKKEWWTPGAWRPIAMSTAGYRIAMRFVKTHISSWACSFLSPQQFGGRPGRSPATATHCLLETLYARRDHSAFATFLDVRNAFSSVPFDLVISLLHRLKFPAGFIHLFSHVLKFGRFHMPAIADPFYASSGIRQGCPLSALLFTLFYDCFLRLLSKWTPVAFVDDLVAVTHTPEHVEEFMQEAWIALRRMGMELNVSKTEVLALGSSVSQAIRISAPIYHSANGSTNHVRSLDPQPPWCCSAAHRLPCQT